MTKLIHIDIHRESLSFKEAIENHRWFLGIKEHHEIDFEEAEEDFIINYLVPWVESNPPVEYVEKNKKNLIKSCTHLKDFNHSQILALKKAIDDDQWYLGEKLKRPVDTKCAEEDFYRNYLRNWAIKFRTGYCIHICEDRHLCKIAEQYRKRALENKGKSPD